MDPDQTAPVWLPQEPSDLGPHCLSKWLPATKADYLCCIGALRVNKCKGQDFHEMHTRLRSSNNLLTLHKITRLSISFSKKLAVV